MGNIVTFIILVRLADKGHYVAGGSDTVLEFWKPRISYTFKDSRQHSRLREILINVLAQNEVSVFNPDKSDSGTFVNIVSLHRVHICCYVETLNIVENSFPLRSNVSVTTDLTNMKHINI